MNRFRKLAREASPLEIQAYLVGKVISVDEVEIVEFVYTKKYHTQTNNSVCWFREDLDNVKRRAEEKGLRVVGDIHSHPNWDAVLSPQDFAASVTEQLIICGICSIHNNRTRVRFWTPNSALTCRITYT